MVWHLDMLCLLLALGCLQAWTLGSCVERVTDTITLDATDVSVLHVTNPLGKIRFLASSQINTKDIVVNTIAKGEAVAGLRSFSLVVAQSNDRSAIDISVSAAARSSAGSLRTLATGPQGGSGCDEGVDIEVVLPSYVTVLSNNAGRDGTVEVQIEAIRGQKWLGVFDGKEFELSAFSGFVPIDEFFQCRVRSDPVKGVSCQTNNPVLTINNKAQLLMYYDILQNNLCAVISVGVGIFGADNYDSFFLIGAGYNNVSEESYFRAYGDDYFKFHNQIEADNGTLIAFLTLWSGSGWEAMTACSLSTSAFQLYILPYASAPGLLQSLNFTTFRVKSASGHDYDFAIHDETISQISLEPVPLDQEQVSRKRLQETYRQPRSASQDFVYPVKVEYGEREEERNENAVVTTLLDPDGHEIGIQVDLMDTLASTVSARAQFTFVTDMGAIPANNSAYSFVPGAVRTTVYDFAGDRSFWFIPLRHQYDKDVIYDYGGNLTAPIGQSILCGYKGLSFLGTISGGSYVLLAGTPLNDDLSWVTPILLRARDALHSVKRVPLCWPRVVSCIGIGAAEGILAYLTLPTGYVAAGLSVLAVDKLVSCGTAACECYPPCRDSNYGN